MRGRGYGFLSWLWILALPLPGQSDPPVTRTAFKRWAGGRQRCRPFKDGEQLISAGGGKPRLCIARAKSAAPRPPPHAFRPRRGGEGSSPVTAFAAHEGRAG